MPPSPRPPLTHFLCIPLVTPSSRPQLQKALQKFKADVTAPSPSPSAPTPSSSTLDPEEDEEDNGWPTPSSTQAGREQESGNEEETQKFHIPESAIRPLGTLHLTLGVMSLIGEERVRGAVELLHNIDWTSLLAPPSSASPGKNESSPGAKEPHPLTISLLGLHSMHTPHNTSILYAAPTSSPPAALLTLCESLRARFMDAGYLVDEGRGLKLHATVVNTVYVKGGRGMGNGRGGGRGAGGGKDGKGGDWGRGHGKRKAKLTFDAREVLERYRDFEWMRDVKVERVAICRMGARKGEDGEEAYEVEAERKMGVEEEGKGEGMV